MPDVEEEDDFDDASSEGEHDRPTNVSVSVLNETRESIAAKPESLKKSIVEAPAEKEV